MNGLATSARSLFPLLLPLFCALPAAAADEIAPGSPFMYGPVGKRKPPAATTAQILSATPKAGGPTTGPAPQAPSAPLTDFEGLDFNPALGPLGLQFIPPDTNGAVGPNHIVVVSNTEVRYLTRAGAEIATSRRTLNDFWNTFGGAGWVANAADHAYDVKIIFDQESQRFFFVSLAAPSRPNAQYLLAVSKGDDPTLGWWTWHWDYSADDTRWIDYPGWGVSSRWVALTANIYLLAGNWVGVHAIVWSKAQLLNGRGAAGGEGGVLYKQEWGPGTNANWDAAGTVMPLYNFDANSPDLYMLQTGWPNPGAAPWTQLRLFSITGNDLAAAHNDLGAVNVDAYGLPPDAWQQGSATLLATGDQRMLTVIRRNGILYAAHTAGCPAAAPTHACVAWYAINPVGPAVVQQGQVDGGAIAYWYPSIAVDPYDNVALGFSGSSQNQYVGGYYTGRRATDPLGTMQAPFQFRQGYNSYVLLDGAGENRWGDFSATATMPDPASDGSFWTLQEVAAATVNRWSLWWAKFTMFPVLGTAVTGLTASANTNSISIAWNAHADATSYDVLRVNVPADDCGTGSVVQSAANPRTYTTPATLTPNQQLKMCVRPTNPNGTGPFVSVTTGTYAAAVTGFGLTASATSITASFTPPGGGQASGYQAEAFQSGTCTGTPDRVVTTSDPAATSIVIGGVVSETTYCVRVGALSAMGHLTYAAGSNVTTDTLLVPPESKAPSSITDTSVQANWGNGGNPNNTQYTMTYSATAGFPPAASTPTATLSLFSVATGLVPNTLYHFKVKPGTNGPETTLPDAITLAQAPTTLSLAAGHPTDAAATLSWDVRSNPGDTSYVLEYATNESFTGATANTYTSSPQTPALGSPNTQYYFRVKAVSRAPAGVSTAWATASGATLPKPPQGPTYDSITFSSVTVRWNAPVSGTTRGFRAEAGSGAGDFTPPVPYAQTSDQAARVLSVTGLSDNTPYLLRVGSLGIDGRTSWTNLGYSTRTSAAVRSIGTVTAAGAVISFTPSFPEATNVSLSIPPGELSIGTKVTVDSSVQFMMGRLASNQAKVQPLGAVAAVEIHTDNSQEPSRATLSFTYNPASIPLGKDVSTLHVCRYNTAAQVWDILPRLLSSAPGTVEAELFGFSLYGPFFVAAGTDLSGVEVFPVPWEPGSGSPFDAPGISFMGMPPSADVKIFTLRGELVWEGPADMSGVLRWDGRTRKGAPAASGVYLASIVSGGQKKLRRVVITR